MALLFHIILNWFNGLRTAMGKMKFLPMLWSCSSQLVLHIPLLNIPYMLKKLPRRILIGSDIEYSIR